jgi:hypothetical protein
VGVIVRQHPGSELNDTGTTRHFMLALARQLIAFVVRTDAK